MNLLASLEKNVELFGDRPVQVANGQVLTYSQLWSRSERLARTFLEHDKSRSPVVVAGGRSIEMLVCFVACLRSGRPYVPVDETFPAMRLTAIVTAIQPAIMIDLLSEVKSPNTGGAKGLILGRPELATVFAQPAAPTGLDPGLAVKPEDILYILFTSGSSGLPKGVQIRRSNVEDFLAWTVPTYGYDQAPQLFLNVAPYSFDLSVYEVYNALVTGGAYLSVTRAQIDELPRLFSFLYNEAKDIEICVSTPSFLGLCIADPAFSAEKLTRLKQFVVIGEVLPKTLAVEILKRFPATRLSNFYGPTEATVATTVFDVTPEALQKYSTVPIGTSKPGSAILLEDGEIVIEGPNVGAGYLNDPTRTERCFSVVQGRRRYRTGDRGHVQDGLLFFDGRNDGQIKFHGYRIELGEIETVICQGSVAQLCRVIALKTDGRVQALVAFVVARSDCKAQDGVELSNRVKKEVRERLPVYMVPRRIILVDEMPMNENGKIDVKALEKLI